MQPLEVRPGQSAADLDRRCEPKLALAADKVLKAEQRVARPRDGSFMDADRREEPGFRLVEDAVAPGHVHVAVDVDPVRLDDAAKDDGGAVGERS